MNIHSVYIQSGLNAKLWNKMSGFKQLQKPKILAKMSITDVTLKFIYNILL